MSVAAPLRVGILLTSQFTLNALANFVDVLRLASDDGDQSRAIRCHWHVMSATSEPARASCGLPVSPTASLIDPKQLDHIAVIGGLLYRGRPIDAAVRAYLSVADKAGVGLIGICTGSFVLCRLGLMDGRTCCVSWYHYRDFIEEFPNTHAVADDLYVVDGNRITCSGGIGSALAAAKLVEGHLGLSAAQKALHIMQIGESTAVLQPAPPMMSANGHNELVTRALLLMEQNITEPLPIEEIASRLKSSRRSLERNFQRHLQRTPHSAYVGLRLGHARRLLGTPKSTSQIAAEAGFSCSSLLSSAYRRAYGHSVADGRREIGARFHSGTGGFDEPRLFSSDDVPEGASDVPGIS